MRPFFRWDWDRNSHSRFLLTDVVVVVVVGLCFIVSVKIWITAEFICKALEYSSRTSTTHTTGIYGCEYTIHTHIIIRSSIICGKLERWAVYSVDIDLTNKRTDKQRKKTVSCANTNFQFFHLFLDRFFKKQLIRFCMCFTDFYWHRCYGYCCFDRTIFIFFGSCSSF